MWEAASITSELSLWCLAGRCGLHKNCRAASHGASRPIPLMSKRGSGSSWLSNCLSQQENRQIAVVGRKDGIACLNDCYVWLRGITSAYGCASARHTPRARRLTLVIAAVSCCWQTRHEMLHAAGEYVCSSSRHRRSLHAYTPIHVGWLPDSLRATRHAPTPIDNQGWGCSLAQVIGAGVWMHGGSAATPIRSSGDEVGLSMACIVTRRNDLVGRNTGKPRPSKYISACFSSLFLSCVASQVVLLSLPFHRLLVPVLRQTRRLNALFAR